MDAQLPSQAGWALLPFISQLKKSSHQHHQAIQIYLIIFLLETSTTLTCTAILQCLVFARYRPLTMAWATKHPCPPLLKPLSSLTELQSQGPPYSSRTVPHRVLTSARDLIRTLPSARQSVWLPSLSRSLLVTT